MLEQLESVLETKSTFAPTRQLLTTINEDIEALESIYQCGLAQERISNDVLSLGRIQLGEYFPTRWLKCPLTSIQICFVRPPNPDVSRELISIEMFDVEVELRSEAQKVLSIFQNEARMKRIGLSLKIGESVGKLGIHHVKTDPVRLGQV